MYKGQGQGGVWDTLTRRFEARMITAALDVTRGRRIEAAQRLGRGRHTITPKIPELGPEDDDARTGPSGPRVALLHPAPVRRFAPPPAATPSLWVGRIDVV